jgi:hypothetical protein
MEKERKSMQPADGEKAEDELSDKNAGFDQEEDYLGEGYKNKQSLSRSTTFKSERKKITRQDTRASDTGAQIKAEEKKDLKLEDIERIRLKRNFLDTYVRL